MAQKGSIIQLLACMCVLLITSSCSVKYHDLVGPEVPQAKVIDDDVELRHQYLRSKTAYDEFQTLAAFDVLWFSDVVCEKYCDLYTMRRGYNQQQREQFLADHKKQLRKGYIFYVLADVRHTQLHDNINDKDAFWLPRLELYDDQGKRPAVDLEQRPFKRMKATSIKEVDLEPELQSLFGTRYKEFRSVKAAYKVVFSEEIDDDQKEKTTDNKKAAEDRHFKDLEQVDGHETVPLLVMSSPYHSCEFEWDLKNLKERKLLKDEDFYWS